MVAQTDDSHLAADDCRADSVAADYSAASDCPVEAGLPQDCSCPDAHSLQECFLPADCRGDFRLPEVAAAVPEAR
jgi:hypothetical protein